LQGWWKGTKSEGRIRNRRVLGQLLHKSERTIRRELARGWVKHDRGNPPFEVWEYNAQYAHDRATEAHGSKGPQYKIGHDRTLCRAIGALVKLCPFEALARDFKDDARILSFIRPGTCLMEC